LTENTQIVKLCSITGNCRFLSLQDCRWQMFLLQMFSRVSKLLLNLAVKFLQRLSQGFQLLFQWSLIQGVMAELL